jgi:hypothetical protein
MTLTFDGYDFDFTVLTTGNYYKPLDLEVSQRGEGIQATAGQLVYGAGTGAMDAHFEARIERTAKGICWQASAIHPEPIKGIKTRISPLPHGRLLVPLRREITLAEGQGCCFVFPSGYYPIRHASVSASGITPEAGPLPWWGAQFLLLEASDRTLCVRGPEHPFGWKRFWAHRDGDSLSLELYSEAKACERKSEHMTPCWYIEQASGREEAIDDYQQWLVDAYGLVPFNQRVDVPSWLPKIALVAMLHGRAYNGKTCHTFEQMSGRAGALSARFPPERTLLFVLGFDGRMDFTWPGTSPDEALGGPAGFRTFIETAHQMGHRVMLHLNVWGVAYDSPSFRELCDHQVRDSEGRLVGWDFDWDYDEIQERVFAYVSPDAPPWRRVLVNRVRSLVADYGIDAIYLDQATTYVNDACHDHGRGVAALCHELRAALPGTLFAGESISEQVMPLYPLGNMGPLDTPELLRRLCRPYVRYFAEALPPENRPGVWSPQEQPWSLERFYALAEAHDRAGTIPSLNLTDVQVDLDSLEAGSVFQRAKRYPGNQTASQERHIR